MARGYCEQCNLIISLFQCSLDINVSIYTKLGTSVLKLHYTYYYTLHYTCERYVNDVKYNYNFDKIWAWPTVPVNALLKWGFVGPIHTQINIFMGSNDTEISISAIYNANGIVIVSYETLFTKFSYSRRIIYQRRKRTTTKNSLAGI